MQLMQARRARAIGAAARTGIRPLHVLAPGKEGGLERVVTMLASAQAGRGAHVAAVLTPAEAKDHPFVRRLVSLDVPVTSIVVGARNYVEEYRRLNALVEQLRPDVVHTHGYRSDVIAGAVARARRIPTVSTVHGFTGNGRGYELIQCVALRRADAVIPVSRMLVDRLMRARIQRRKIHFVPNGFAPPLDADLVDRDNAREWLGIGSDALVAAWVGRLSREKGADVMIEAVAKCDPAWRFSIIGDGPERDALVAQARRLGVSDRITWHGMLPNAGLLLPAFDAFVLSSRTEGTPIALFEAMYAGVPIVATEVGGVPDVISPAHGLLVPSENPSRIAQALHEITRRDAAAAQRSILARARLLQSFNDVTWLASIDDVYRRVCAKGKTRFRMQRSEGKT